MHFVSDVEVLLADVEVDEFRRRLGEYGYDSQRADLYRAEPGISPFHLEPRFFADVDLLRLRRDSFVGGRPPTSVLGISYRLLLTGEPVPVWEEEGVLDRLLA